MSRSERYITPSAEELARMCQAEEAATQFDRGRTELLRTALKRIEKVDLVEQELHKLAEASRSIE